MTAVEQLVSNIRALAYDKKHHLGMGDIRITQGLLDELEEQAKELEKEQIIKTARYYFHEQGKLTPKQYYNEIFKSE